MIIIYNIYIYIRHEKNKLMFFVKIIVHVALVFLRKKNSRPWFSSTQEAKFQQFPYDFLVRELDREQRPIQCPGRRPWPRC